MIAEIQPQPTETLLHRQTMLEADADSDQRRTDAYTLRSFCGQGATHTQGAVYRR